MRVFKVYIYMCIHIYFVTIDNLGVIHAQSRTHASVRGVGVFMCVMCVCVCVCCGGGLYILYSIYHRAVSVSRYLSDLITE